MEPIAAAFAAGWPTAELANILDDSLAPDRARDGEISDAMFARFASLSRYAVDIGADAICSHALPSGPPSLARPHAWTFLS